MTQITTEQLKAIELLRKFKPSFDKLLDQYSDVLACNGCNDWKDTTENCKLLEQLAVDFKVVDEDFPMRYSDGPTSYTYDWLVLAVMREILTTIGE